jgi:DNA repair protein RecN (Recombination protein N)
MLTFLRVRNLAVLRDVEVALGAGLNVLSGETGAGKSILVDALGLLLGERADAERVRRGASSAIVEGEFTSASPETRRALKEAGIDAEEEEPVVVRRELSTEAPNRVFVNETLTSLATLRTLMEPLVALHGQNRHLTLAGRDAQRRFLDTACLPGEDLTGLAQAWRGLMEAVERREAHEGMLAQAAQRLEWLRFQLEEIDGLDPRPGEDEELRREERLLATAEERASRSGRLLGLLLEDESSAATLLARAETELEALSAMDSRLDGTVERLREVGYVVEDLVARFRASMPAEEADPSRLAGIQDRLAALQTLARKHGGSLAGALAFAEGARREVDELEDGEETTRVLRQREREAAARFDEQAREVGRRRRAAARKLSAAVESELADLDLAGARFRIQVSGDGPPAPADVASVVERGGPSGYERVEFLFAAHPGDKMLSLAKTASGGELSRLMLALYLVTDSDGGGGPQTSVFDEVDAGIGGRAAGAIGHRLLQTAGRRQVICVTHLPQIAALADRHLRLAKAVIRKRPATAVTRLEGDERVNELARMLGEGESPETARRHAEALLSGPGRSRAPRSGVKRTRSRSAARGAGETPWA